jgi:hypothetical protein
MPRSDCFAQRRHGPCRHGPAISPRISREFYRTSCPRKTEGAGAPQERAQGKPGARCTRGLMCHDAHSKMHTSIQVQRKQSGLPCAMVLTAYAVLSSATNSSCHRHRRIEVLPNPVEFEKASADLTPATGAGTTRFCRPRAASRQRFRRAWYPSAEVLAKAVSASFVCAPPWAHRSCDLPCPRLARPTPPRPPHPIPTFVTMANAPREG